MTAAGFVLAAAVSTPSMAVKFSARELDEGIVDDSMREVHPKIHLPLFAGLTLAALASIVANVGYSPMAFALIGFAILCIPMVLIDLVDYIIPNEISYGALGIGAAGVLLTAFGSQTSEASKFPFLGSALPQSNVLDGAIQGMCVMTILYAVLHLVSADFGMGDVKLSASTGLILGAFGWEYVVAGFFATFLSAIVISVVAKSLAEGRAGVMPTIAFGPYMLLGTLLAFPFAPLMVNLYHMIGSI